MNSSAHAAKSTEENSDEGEKLHLCPVSQKVKAPQFTQSAERVRCYRIGLLLFETHPSIVERRCSMASIGVMQILPTVTFYFYIALLSAKCVSLLKLIMSRIGNQHSRIRHTCTKRWTPHNGQPRVDSVAYAYRKWVETNSVIPLGRVETP